MREGEIARGSSSIGNVRRECIFALFEYSRDQAFLALIEGRRRPPTNALQNCVASCEG